MTTLTEQLQMREQAGLPVTVGVIGAGTFGTQIIAQACSTMGMRVGAVLDLDPDRAVRAYAAGGVDPSTIIHAATASEIDAALSDARPAVARSLDDLLASGVDFVVEATGNPEAGARHAFEAISADKHVVMVTVEADVVVGTFLKAQADTRGVMYSLAYGDEPAFAVELCEWARTLGFRVIAAGKGTRFIPAFRKAVPDDVPKLYGYSGTDYNAQVFCSFLDGTKHAIEMTALANSAGLSVDVRGMHFPAISIRELPDVLCHERHGGLLHSEGVVEAVSAMRADETYVERNLRGGVFAVVEPPSEYVRHSIAEYGDIVGAVIGERSGHLLVYKPQHLIGHEVPLGIARMALYGQTAGAPVAQLCEVVACAKRALQPGDRIDGEGGWCVAGMVERADVAAEQGLVPLALTNQAIVSRPIPDGGFVSYDDVRLADSYLLELRQRATQVGWSRTPSS